MSREWFEQSTRRGPDLSEKRGKARSNLKALQFIGDLLCVICTNERDEFCSDICTHF